MYCSLDRIDIELAPKKGRPRLVQTDHRSADEMVARPALSQIAILIRCLNPRRQYREVDIFYNFAHERPELIARVVGVAGAHLCVGDEASFIEADVAHQKPDHAGVDLVANIAFWGLDSFRKSGDPTHFVA